MHVTLFWIRLLSSHANAFMNLCQKHAQFCNTVKGVKPCYICVKGVRESVKLIITGDDKTASPRKSCFGVFLRTDFDFDIDKFLVFLKKILYLLALSQKVRKVRIWTDTRKVEGLNKKE